MNNSYYEDGASLLYPHMLNFNVSPLTTEEAKLVSDNLGIVRAVYERMKHKLCRLPLDEDDFISIGTFGLIYAVKKNSEGNYNLPTLAWRIIHNRYCDLIKYYIVNAPDEVIGIPEEVYATTSDEVAEWTEQYILTMVVLDQSGVTEEERDVLMLNVVHCVPMREIAKRKGIHRSKVGRLKTRAVNKLRKALDVDVS